MLHETWRIGEILNYELGLDFNVKKSVIRNESRIISLWQI